MPRPARPGVSVHQRWMNIMDNLIKVQVLLLGHRWQNCMIAYEGVDRTEICLWKRCLACFCMTGLGQVPSWRGWRKEVQGRYHGFLTSFMTYIFDVHVCPTDKTSYMFEARANWRDPYNLFPAA